MDDKIKIENVGTTSVIFVKGVKGAKEWDLKMSKARKILDWETQIKLAIDPELAKKKRNTRNEADEEACSMCGEYCAVKIISQYFDKPSCPCID